LIVKQRKPKKWLIAGLLAALAVLGVVAPQFVPIAEVIAEVLEPNVWVSQEEPFPVPEG